MPGRVLDEDPGTITGLSHIAGVSPYLWTRCEVGPGMQSYRYRWERRLGSTGNCWVRRPSVAGDAFILVIRALAELNGDQLVAFVGRAKFKG